jgi:hypothetical protein
LLPLAAHSRANVGIKKTTRSTAFNRHRLTAEKLIAAKALEQPSYLILMELLNLTFECEFVAGGTQMPNSLH